MNANSKGTGKRAECCYDDAPSRRILIPTTGSDSTLSPFIAGRRNDFSMFADVYQNASGGSAVVHRTDNSSRIRKAASLFSVCGQWRVSSDAGDPGPVLSQPVFPFPTGRSIVAIAGADFAIIASDTRLTSGVPDLHAEPAPALQPVSSAVASGHATD